MSSRFGVPSLLFSVALVAPCCAQESGPGEQPAVALSDDPTTTPSDFVRFVAAGEGGHLDTAVTTYRKGDVEVVLYGAVHIADEACYELLNDRFTSHDALLYELVAPPDHRPEKEREVGMNPLTLLQMGLRNSLGLTFQLDVIDYQATNFVHADMTPEEFRESMAERGESLLSIMWGMMVQGMKVQREKMAEADAGAAPEIDLVKAFQSGEGRHTLRLTFAAQLEELETLAAGGGKEGGSTLLEGRNQKCLEVLRQQIAQGRKNLGIYYGAAHLPDMEQHLVDDLGFAKVGHEWIVAWDCAPRPDPKFDRALIRQRRQCKKDMAVLAEAMRDYRREVDPDHVATVAEIAAAQKDGKPRYTGPLQDPWGNDYVIEKRKFGSRWQLRSLGQDGERVTDDDIRVQEPRLGGLKWF
ncbi:MAG: type II secretion system protein GspG [Planctomycetes bacterium]|nr:type II secretion system protein GspG [Planctomycetota bacterium]